MRYLDKLLEDVDVEWKSLGEACANIISGKNKIRDDSGLYPVFGSTGVIGKTNDKVYEHEQILIARVGANAGYVHIAKGQYDVSDNTLIVQVNELIILKYLYYLLVNMNLNQFAQGAGQPLITAGQLKSLVIPVPPLPVQKDIVRILDTFTELIGTLTAELAARKKQYNYYREQLFSFNDVEVKWETLGEIIVKSYSGSTPKAGSPQYYDNGTIPWLRTQEVNFSEIENTEIKITDLAVKNTAAKWIPVNCVIIAISGATAGRSAINKIPLTTNQHCLCLEINSQKALYKYVFHWVSFKYESLKGLGQGARGDLNAGIIKNFKIPLPSLEKQKRIVYILDKFDTLITSISEGLPGEIELRKKQYEYYRDMLLTFPRPN